MICKTHKKQQINDPAAWIENTILEFCRTSPENTLKNVHNDRAFDDPLVGFANGGDPLFEDLKKDIGPPFMTPIEVFRTSFPETDARADELTVISWILPKTRLTKNDNSKETTYPSERWVRAMHFGEEFNTSLLVHVVETLKNAGFVAVAPVNAPFWTIGISERYGLASSWSERHAAYVSGLGTFGLCDGLITMRGKAVSCGSVIARIAVPPTPRPYTDHHAWCLFYAKGECGLCIKRCPAGALSKEGHNKNLCQEYSYGDGMKSYVRGHFGIDGCGCGLCQTGVPCEFANPVQAAKKLEPEPRTDPGSLLHHCP